MFPVWDDIVDCLKYRLCSPERLRSPFRLDYLQTVDIIFKHKRRKDRLAAVAKAIAVVRGKGELRECLLDLQWKVNEQRSWAKLFLFMTSQQQWPFFFLFVVNLLK